MQNYSQLHIYDELGNILQMQSINTWTRDYIYDTSTNRLLKHDQNQSLPDYTYYAHGNILTISHLSDEMQWDWADRVRKITEKAGDIEERIYLGGYEVYRNKISGFLDFERQTLHIDDDNKKVAFVETKTFENGSSISNPVSNIRYQYNNHLGSACLELDDSASIISYEEFHPFGTTSYRSGSSESEVSLKRYKYVGKERDEETGLYYYGARYYASWIGRFVSVDPLQDKYPYYTPYQYAGNKPVTMLDIDGNIHHLCYGKSDEIPTTWNVSRVTRYVSRFSRHASR